MKLVILTHNFPPEIGAKSARLFELAKRLTARGHQVRVITAMPNYPTGCTFDGYRGKVRMAEEVEGIPVVRTWIYPSNSSRALPRLCSSLSFTLSSMLLGPWRLGRQDVLLFDSPPLFLVPSGLAIGRITGARVIMNVSDVWPDIALRLGYPLGKLSLWLLRCLERLGYEKSDLVTLTNPTAMRQVEERFPQVNATVISNGADLDLFSPSLRSQGVRSSLGAGPEDFLVGYCGLHGLFQGLETVVEAAYRLRDHPRIRFVLVGDGPTKSGLVELARRRGLTNIRFESPVPRSEISAILASCDAGLAPLATELPGTMPSKVFETLASGVPVVVSAGCEGATLVQKFDAGRTFRPGDAHDLAAVLADLATSLKEGKRMGERGLAVAHRFDRDQIAIQAEEVLMAVIEGAPLPEVDC